VAYPFWFLIAPLRPLSGNDCNPDFDWAATGGEQIIRFLPVFSLPHTHYSLMRAESDRAWAGHGAASEW